MAPDDERVLVARLRAGDTGAFDDLYEVHRPRVFAFLLRMTRRRTVAEDLLDETWLRLVRHAARLLPDTRLGPWLFTVACNLYWSQRRDALVEESSVAELLTLWPSPAPWPSPFDLAAAGELARRVERALSTLSPQHREVLLLIGHEGLTPTDAAVICGISPEEWRMAYRPSEETLQAFFASRGSPATAIDTPETASPDADEARTLGVHSSVMCRLLDAARLAAQAKSTVLITGESGVGNQLRFGIGELMTALSVQPTDAFRRPNVLIVDDSKDDRELYATFLITVGECKVTCAANASEALTAFARGTRCAGDRSGAAGCRWGGSLPAVPCASRQRRENHCRDHGDATRESGCRAID